MSDREYFRFAKAWHGFRDYEHPPGDVITVLLRAICGRLSPIARAEWADRVPVKAHLCSSCGRDIAAATDMEEDPTMGVAVPT